jgi:hypothetical protein
MTKYTKTTIEPFKKSAKTAKNTAKKSKIAKKTRKTMTLRSSQTTSVSVKKLKKLSDAIFKTHLKTNEYYRINVQIECFYFIQNILNKIYKDETIDINDSNAVIDAIAKEIKTTIKNPNKTTSTFLLLKGGGVNIKDVIKFLYLIAMGGYMILKLSKGIPRCQETKTIQTIQKNFSHYYSADTKCKFVELPYFSSYINELFTTTEFEQKLMHHTIVNPMNTIYSIYLCDEYAHLGHEAYCEKNQCWYPKKLIDDATAYISTFTAYTTTMGATTTATTTTTDVIKKTKGYSDFFMYFFANNLKEDFNTITNDIDICQNNVISPIFWILLSGGVGNLFIHIFSKILKRRT